MKKDDDEEDDGFNFDEWEIGFMDSEFFGGWIDVSSDEEDDGFVKKKVRKIKGGDDDDGDEVFDFVEKEDLVVEVERIMKFVMMIILMLVDLVKL